MLFRSYYRCFSWSSTSIFLLPVRTRIQVTPAAVAGGAAAGTRRRSGWRSLSNRIGSGRAYCECRRTTGWRRQVGWRRGRRRRGGAKGQEPTADGMGTGPSLPGQDGDRGNAGSHTRAQDAEGTKRRFVELYLAAAGNHGPTTTRDELPDRGMRGKTNAACLRTRGLAAIYRRCAARRRRRGFGGE